MKDHPDIAVVGQIARDLVLVVDEMPDTGTSAAVRQRREMLGGKGANQAVGLAQLGVQVAVLGVVGADDTGEWLLAQAEKDGIDVDRVLRRGESGLILDVVDGEGRWRYLEDLPKSALLSEEDVRAAKDLLGSARYVVVQLQQPADAVLAALRCAKEAGGRVVVDGVPDRASLSMVDVLRADAREAELLMDRRIRSSRDALRAGRELLRDGPGLVAFAVQDEGNAFVWDAGELFLPLQDADVADTTGAGDAFVAALTAALLRKNDVESAAREAVRAAGLTVRHPGGRPDLSSIRVSGGAE